MMQQSEFWINTAELNVEQSAAAALMALNKSGRMMMADEVKKQHLAGTADGGAPSGSGQIILEVNSPNSFENSSNCSSSFTESSETSSQAVQPSPLPPIFNHEYANANAPPVLPLSSVSETTNSSSIVNAQPKKRTIRDPQSHRMSEKRRRERINASLADLRGLIPKWFLQKIIPNINRSRIEKTEVINAAIAYLKHLIAITEPLVTDSKDEKSASAKSDKLFAFCQSSSKIMASLCLSDRFRFHQLGYQECLNEAETFVKKWGAPKGSADLMVRHLGRYKNTIDLSIISKHMKDVSDQSLEPMEVSTKDDVYVLRERIDSGASSSSTLSSNTLTTDDFTSSVDISSSTSRDESSNDSLERYLKQEMTSSFGEVVCVDNNSPSPVKWSPTSDGGSGNHGLVQAFALHPGGQHLIPFRVDASILGLETMDFSPKKKKKTNDENNSPTKVTPNQKRFCGGDQQEEQQQRNNGASRVATIPNHSTPNILYPVYSMYPSGGDGGGVSQHQQGHADLVGASFQVMPSPSQSFVSTPIPSTPPISNPYYLAADQQQTSTPLFSHRSVI